jgi:hypothetical protein
LFNDIGYAKLALMKNRFPLYGILGILSLILSELFLFQRVEPFLNWFYCFAWWSYILTVDAVIFWLKGNSLISARIREFLLMIPWSIFIWLIFEAANLSLKNWYYINLPRSLLERWLGYAVAYGTVLPGLFETTELLETLGLFKRSTGRMTNRATLIEANGVIPAKAEIQKNTGIRIKPGMTNCMRVMSPFIKISSGLLVALVLLGAFCLFFSILMPGHCFPLLWVGFIFLLEPFNYRLGGRSLLRDLEAGNPRRIYLLLIAGLICGLLWEFWNFWAISKWIYTVPFLDKTKGFEMPYLGYLGFPPFAIQAYVIYNFISLFRFERGWEESTYRLHPDQQTRRLTSVLTAILMVSFFILAFQAIDLKTVDSYYPRLKDAYWIELHYRAELPKVGIASLEDLVMKTRDKLERDELALRLLVPKEEVLPWIEKARLALLKGLGIENLRLLESVGVSSVSALALQDPEKLHGVLEENLQGKSVPGLAKIRIWIKEAQKRVQRPE